MEREVRFYFHDEKVTVEAVLKLTSEGTENTVTRSRWYGGWMKITVSCEGPNCYAILTAFAEELGLIQVLENDFIQPNSKKFDLRAVLKQVGYPTFPQDIAAVVAEDIVKFQQETQLV